MADQIPSPGFFPTDEMVNSDDPQKRVNQLANLNNLLRYILSNIEAVNVATGTTGALGTVTSVGLSMPTDEFSVSGSPVTTSGTLTATKKAQLNNTVWAGPTSAPSAIPNFRKLVLADLPALVGAGGIGAPVLEFGSTTPIPLPNTNGAAVLLPVAVDEFLVQGDFVPGFAAANHSFVCYGQQATGTGTVVIDITNIDLGTLISRATFTLTGANVYAVGSAVVAPSAKTRCSISYRTLPAGDLVTTGQVESGSWYYRP